jgi:hypothetical protein
VPNTIRAVVTVRRTWTAPHRRPEARLGDEVTEGGAQAAEVHRIGRSEAMLSVREGSRAHVVPVEFARRAGNSSGLASS